MDTYMYMHLALASSILVPRITDTHIPYYTEFKSWWGLCSIHSKIKPDVEEEKKEVVVKKPKDAFSNDILNELDEEDIAELASKYNCKEWEWIRAATNSSFGIWIFA